MPVTGNQHLNFQPCAGHWLTGANRRYQI